jgi:acyl-[acyl-carrier-protein] desaturase
MQLESSILGLPDGVAASIDAAKSPVLSGQSRQLVVGRCCHALYRWYVSRSQELRNWNPDRTFDWRRLRNDHDDRLVTIIEGFYAVEQYAPDYTAQLTTLARCGYGRSQFQIRWGAEEEKHADLWRNVLLFGRARSFDQLEQYTQELRRSAWEAPFDTPLEMLFYTVFQERATQLIYLKTAACVRDAVATPGGKSWHDPVLAEAIAAIAVDEAAHYDFFLALARVHLYYFPEDALEALVNVLRNFVMPAADIVPNYDAFIKVLYESRLFGPAIYGREVAKPALAALGVESVKAAELSLVQARATPSLDGAARPAAYAGCNFGVLESAVRGLFDRIHRYESEVGLADVQPTVFAAVA